MFFKLHFKKRGPLPTDLIHSLLNLSFRPIKSLQHHVMGGKYQSFLINLWLQTSMIKIYLDSTKT